MGGKTPLKPVNWVTTQFTRLGVGPARILTTTGNRSGRPSSNPVAPLIINDVEYLVAPYGVVGWVLNARANPIATLRRGLKVRQVRLVEVTGEDPAVVSRFYRKNPIPRRSMDLPDEPVLADFEEAADRFPVFRVDPAI